MKSFFSTISVRSSSGATLSRLTHNGNRARIAVSDTGEGILRENLDRIFSHGFSTKKDGHGFGLHSAMLAAKEMDGLLYAQSDGLGHGATFVLELPLPSSEGTAPKA